MGLFNTQNNAAIEQEVLQKMKTSQLLDWLIDMLVSDPKAQWMKLGKHGDSGWRNVIVKPSGFIIEIPHAYDKRDESSFVAVNFEGAGFNSLDAHRNKQGGVVISRSRMCYLYATALQTRLHDILKDCEFSRVTMDRDLSVLSNEDIFFCIEMMTDRGKYAKFSYRVPVPVTSSLY